MRTSEPSRLLFVDFARAFAVMQMIQGHTLDALLDMNDRTTASFFVWSFLRGLTVCIFLTLSGFVFALAASRHWTGRSCSSPTERRFKRFGLFLILGYALHLPVATIGNLRFVSPDQWHAFLAVDVLQCIAITLILLQLIVLAVPTRRRFVLVSAICCFAVVVLTPTVWQVDWRAHVPLVIAAYMSPHTGSLFPLFPWSAYVMLGVILAEAYLRWGDPSLKAFADRVFLGGVATLVASFVGTRMPLQPLGQTDFWSTSPNQFLLRSGLVLLALGVTAYTSLLVSRAHPLVRAIGRESLVIYVVHIGIVYGSVWSPGLRQRFGPTLPLLSALGWVVVLWVGAVVLAWGWSSCKRTRPRTAQYLRLATAGMLAGKLVR